MNFDEMTVKQVKELQALFGTTDKDESVFKVGEKYMIRTVTMTLTGQVERITKQELLLKDAAWIADTGRYADALKDQTKFSEVEPYINNVIVGRGSIVDATTITLLPREQK